MKPLEPSFCVNLVWFNTGEYFASCEQISGRVVMNNFKAGDQYLKILSKILTK